MLEVVPRHPAISPMFGDKNSKISDWQGNTDVTMDMNDSDDDLDIAESVAKDLKTGKNKKSGYLSGHGI